MQEMSELLESIVNTRAAELVKDDLVYKDQYEYLKCMLEDMIIEAVELKSDMDINQLTASGIEAEGFLRFALNVKALLQEDEPNEN